MARYDPPDYGADDPTVFGNYGYGDGPGGYGQQPQPTPPTPGWRKPLALVGWGVLIAALIALIVYGIIQLAHGRPTPASVTTTVTTTTPPTTTTAPTTTTRTTTTTTTTTTTCLLYTT
ncbi:oligopeptide transporter substrate-binding protein, partial [Mycobacterium persicum]|uniref:oligopeptide transporter substrate-binding protein n=1 Tax=Mycobacterium persicum TaxID=1487726 RepID=UPI000C06F15C